MKKITAVMLTLILLVSLSCSSMADNVIAPILESARTLLFDTENVTLRGHAVFSLNGERFKTADILYKQAGEDSHWQLDLLTPRLYRKDQETGFTVIANGEKIYVMERYYPGTYKTGSDQPNSTLFRQSTHADLLFSMLTSLSGQTEPLLPEDTVTVADSDTGRDIQISLSEDTVPDVANAALNLAAEFFLRRFMAVNYDAVREWGQGRLSDYTTVTQGILYSTDSFLLGDTSVTLSEDRNGRITAVSGTLTALLCSEEMSRMPLSIVFDLTVSDYGATSVDTFSPENFSVVLKGDELPQKETESALTERLTARAKDLFAAAGYDVSSLPPSAVNEKDGFFYVNFIGEDDMSAFTAAMNEDGDLLNLSDNTAGFLMSSPREPADDQLPAETADALSKFIKQAFPALADTVQEYALFLEYSFGEEIYQYIAALDSNGKDTGIALVLQTEPSVKIVYYTCLNR